MMEDFPWEIFKTETLQRLGHDLGIQRDFEKDEAVAFLKAVQRKGLGPALAEQITKELTAPGSSQVRQSGVNGHAKSLVAPGSPNAKGRAAPSTLSRRISTRKRPAPEPEPEPEPLFLEGARTEDEDSQEGSDNERKKRRSAKEKEPESISAIARNTRQKGVKRVRVSDPGPPPARSTRSHGPVPSISVVIQRTSSREKINRPLKRAQADTKPKGSAAGAASLSEKRSTRRLTNSQAAADDESTDTDADGEDEVVDEEEEADRFTGPGALAAALMKANKDSQTPHNRRRPLKSASVSSRTRKEGPVDTATATKSKPRPAITSRARSGNLSASTSVNGPRTAKRTIKPTAKGALLSPPKATSILSRQIRPNVQRRLQAQNAKKAKSDPRSKRDNETDEKSESPREVFDGVVLKKRRVLEPNRVVADAVVVSGDVGGNLAVQLDEFVANGLAGRDVPAGAGMDVDQDPVLERDDASSLGGSNKENDFLFRNVSESTEGPEIGHLTIDEEDAEGEPEHETDAAMQESQPQPQPQPQAEELVQPIDDDTPRSPLQPIPQPTPGPGPIESQLQQPQFESLQVPLELEPQPEVQAEPQTEPQPEPAVVPQSIL